MKIKLVIIIIIISKLSFAQELDTILKSEKWVKGYYKSGKLSIAFTVDSKTGITDGMRLNFYENGILRLKEFFTMGILDSSYSYFTNGSLNCYIIFNGKQGYLKAYYKTGELKEECIIDREYHPIGKVTGYYKNGIKMFETIVINKLENGTRTIFSEVNENQKILEQDILNGILIQSRIYVEGKLVYTDKTYYPADFNIEELYKIKEPDIDSFGNQKYFILSDDEDK